MIGDRCIQCDRLLTSSSSSAAGGNDGRGIRSSSATPSSVRRPGEASASDGTGSARGPGFHHHLPGGRGGRGGGWAEPIDPLTSFVLVNRMADMSMSSMHVQDAIGAAASAQHRRSVSSTGEDGFHNVEGSQHHMIQPGLSEHLKRAEMVLKYGTGKVQLDSAACTHCLDAMQQSLDKELEELNKEESMYSAVIKEAQAHSPMGLTRESLAELEATRAAHEEGLRALEEQFELSQAEAAGLEAELSELIQQQRALEEAERDFWSRLLEHELKAQDNDDECSTTLKEIDGLHQRAAELGSASALSGLLSVFLDGGGLGKGGDLCVNGFRLARREAPKRDLCWPEIDAAWGQVVLILKAVSNHVDFHSPRYQAIYMGPASRILQDPGLKTQVIFPLFVVKRTAPRIDESIRRVCFFCADLQRHVLAMDAGLQLDLHLEERLLEMDLVSGLRDEASWNQATMMLASTLRWLLRVVTTSSIGFNSTTSPSPSSSPSSSLTSLATR